MSKLNRLIGRSFLIAIFLVVFESVYSNYLFFLNLSTFYIIRDVFSGVCFLLVLVMLVRGMLPPVSRQNVVFYLFMVFQVFFLPIFSAIMAYINYGQPLLFGILAERERLVSFSALVLYGLLFKGNYSLKDFDRKFLKIAWISLVFYLGIRALYQIDPSFFPANESYSIMDTKTIANKGGVSMRVALALLVYSIIYYFIEYFNTKQLKSLFKMFLFIAFIVIFNKGRGVVFFVSMSMLIYYYKNSQFSSKLILGIFLCFIALFYIAGNIGIDNDSRSPSFINSYLNIVETIKNTSGGEFTEGAEGSTWARLFDLNLIMNSFAQSNSNWLFGMGLISNQYNGGTSKIISKYFFPVDVGIAGATFLYGVIIVLIYKFIYVIIYKNFNTAGHDDDISITTMKYFIVYFFISSLQTASDIIGTPEILLCFLAFSMIYSNGKRIRY